MRRGCKHNNQTRVESREFHSSMTPAAQKPKMHWPLITDSTTCVWLSAQHVKTRLCLRSVTCPGGFIVHEHVHSAAAKFRELENLQKRVLDRAPRDARKAGNGRQPKTPTEMELSASANGRTLGNKSRELKTGEMPHGQVRRICHMDKCGSKSYLQLKPSVGGRSNSTPWRNSQWHLL